jgi:sigma-E factor negative regulatory protein RseB
VLNVWHPPGGVALAGAVAAAPRWSREAPHPVLPASYLGSPALVGGVMLGLSPRLVRLLSTNYRVTAAGWGQAAGRPAQVITAVRPDGRVAARLWLDRATALPLRRETFDGRGRMVSYAAFTGVTIGPASAGRPVASAPRPWVAARPARLHAQGWPVPGPLPGGLVLLGARQGRTTTGPVVDLDYSDGLSLVSVFVQRGHLRSRLAGWSRVARGSSLVYADDAHGQTFAWSARGFVYTVVAAAPPQTVTQVVAALPHDTGPGLLGRFRQGWHRLLSWLIP